MPYDPDAPTATEMVGGDRREVPVPDLRERLASARRAIIAEQLRSREGIAGLRAWRGLDRLGSGVRKVRRACDVIAATRRTVREVPPLGARGGEGELRVARNPSHPPLTRMGGTRVDELIALLAPSDFSPSTGVGARGGGAHPEVTRIAEQVRRATTSEGEVDVFDLLTSDAVAAGAKANWLETQLASAIRFLEARDLADARAAAAEPPPEEVLQEKERAPEENVPPPDADSFAPSVDKLECAAEGEPGVFFTVRPFYGGYYRGRDYDAWDTQSMRWVRLKTRPAPASVDTRITDERSRRVTSGTVRAGTATALPVPYGFVPDSASLKVHGGGSARVLADGRGGWLVEAAGEGLVSFTIEIGRTSDLGVAAPPLVTRAVPEDAVPAGYFAEKTERFLATWTNKQLIPVYAQARILKAWTKDQLAYSNDSTLNAVHRNGDPARYFSRIEASGKADCDVANSYFAALCSRVGIPVRMVPGHYVKTKDRTGAAVLSSGTAHAWVEVWDPTTPGGRDGGWHTLDATPPGDPNMDEGDPDEQDAESLGEGDYGESDALSSDELEQMIQEAIKELDRKEREPKERAAAAFAEQAGEGCTPEEAKAILTEIAAARELRDDQGVRIRDRLMEEFGKIVREHLRPQQRYEEPVRMSAGEEIADPVSTVLDLRAGVADPTGFGRHRQRMEVEQVYGGMDVVLVADKSGSMSMGGPSGILRYREQQRLLFLAFDALHEAAGMFRAHRVRLVTPIDVRFGLVTFQADGAATPLPLGEQWGPKEQLQVWRALQQNIGGGTPDHLGMVAAGEMLGVAASGLTPSDSLSRREGEKKEKNFPPSGEGGRGGEAKDRVHVVLEYSDGESDDATAFAKVLAALRRDGVVADAYRKDLAGFPPWVAKQIIGAAARLHPKRMKR